jgi:SP family sugar:H+ symporter-like MFS transporter
VSEHAPVPESTVAWTDEETAGATGTVVRLASVAAIGGFLFGYDSAVINGAVGAVEARYSAGALALGLTVSSTLVGAAAGAVVAGRLADRFGRLAVMWLSAAMFLVSAIGAGFAWDLFSLAVFRFIGGVGVGAASVIAPTYIAEIAPAGIRGRLGSLQQLAIVLGIFLALLADFAIAAAAGGSEREWLLGLEAWRWMFLSMAVPAVLYGVLALTIPESPRHLVATGQSDKARGVLRRLLGGVNLDDKIEQIRLTLVRETKPSMRDLRGPVVGLLPIVWVGIGLSVFQQFVGINVIFYYSSVLWQAVGFEESDALLITVITSVVNVLTTLIAIATIDRLGRKPLLLIGSVGMAVTLGLMAILFGTAPVVEGQPVLSGASGPIALIAANLYVVAFGMSWGPVVWVLLGEKFPNRIRAAALGVAAAAQWIANWLISTTFPALADIGLGLAYGLYAASAIVSFFFVMLWVRETKGMELEAMRA